MAIETIQIKRGLKANLPRLAEGELALSRDTYDVFIGTANGNIQAFNPNLTTQVNTNTANIQTNTTNIAANTTSISNMKQSGITASRPTTGLYVGMPFFDTTLGKPVFCSNTSTITWVDATGATV